MFWVPQNWQSCGYPVYPGLDQSLQCTPWRALQSTPTDPLKLADCSVSLLFCGSLQLYELRTDHFTATDKNVMGVLSPSFRLLQSTSTCFDLLECGTACCTTCYLTNRQQIEAVKFAFMAFSGSPHFLTTVPPAFYSLLTIDGWLAPCLTDR